MNTLSCMFIINLNLSLWTSNSVSVSSLLLHIHLMCVCWTVFLYVCLFAVCPSSSIFFAMLLDIFGMPRILSQSKKQQHSSSRIHHSTHITHSVTIETYTRFTRHLFAPKKKKRKEKRITRCYATICVCSHTHTHIADCSVHDMQCNAMQCTERTCIYI